MYLFMHVLTAWSEFVFMLVPLRGFIGEVAYLQPQEFMAWSTKGSHPDGIDPEVPYPKKGTRAHAN
jgi:hypothetical protein